MQTYNTKLIVLRGNSGSGKSTIARIIKDKFKDRKLGLVEQDYLRRDVLGVKDFADGPQHQLILNTAKYCFEQNYEIVILEGILTFNIYKDMLKQFEIMCPDNHFFYFKLPLEETLNRHNNKPEEFKQAVPVHKIESWYLENDLTGFASEKVITHDMSKEDIVEFILKESGI